MRLAGIDFTSAPRARKPITVATAAGLRTDGGRPRIALEGLEGFEGFAAWEDWLRTPGLRHPADAATTSWHLYTVQIDFAAIGRARADVMRELRAAGVGTQVLYIPVHLQPWYRRTYGYGPGKCPVAESYYLRALSLPLYPAMSDADVAHVIGRVRALAPATVAV